jgi:hypothetical protein
MAYKIEYLKYEFILKNICLFIFFIPFELIKKIIYLPNGKNVLRS